MTRRLFSLALAAPLLRASGEVPTVFFSKDFPGSSPAYFEVTLAESGEGSYRESREEDPAEIQLDPTEVATIFALARKLNNLKVELESGLPVAKTGLKTLRWQNGAERNEVQFNYTQDETGRQIQEWFEKIAESQRLLFRLEHSARFDKLGINDVVLDLHSAWNRNRIAGSKQFLPILDRIAKNASYVNVARRRAADLATLIRSPRPVGQ